MEDMGDITNQANAQGTYDRRHSLHENAKSLAQALNNFRRNSERSLDLHQRSWSSTELQRSSFGSSHSVSSAPARQQPTVQQHRLDFQHSWSKTLIPSRANSQENLSASSTSKAPRTLTAVQAIAASASAMDHANAAELILNQQKQIGQLEKEKTRLANALLKVHEYVKKAKKESQAQTRRLDFFQEYCNTLEQENALLRMQMEQLVVQPAGKYGSFHSYGTKTPTYANGGSFFPDNDSVPSSHGDSFYYASHRSGSSFVVSEQYFPANSSLGRAQSFGDSQRLAEDVHTSFMYEHHDGFRRSSHVEVEEEETDQVDNEYDEQEQADLEEGEGEEDGLVEEDEEDEEEYRQYEDLEPTPVLQLG